MEVGNAIKTKPNTPLWCRWSHRNAVTLMCLFALVGAALLFICGQLFERQLLLADPDSLMPRSALSDYALARGNTLFDAQCAICHGRDGRGNRVLGVPDLTDQDYLYGTGRASEIEDIVRHGIRAGDRRGRNFAYMPAYAKPRPYPAEPIPPLTPAETQEVVQLLLSYTGRTTDSTGIARGKAVYLGKGGCYDCHGGDAKGDSAIGAPNLTDNIWLYGDGSARAIIESIEHGRKGYSPAFNGRLTAADMRAVAVYTASLAHNASAVGTPQ